jgi:hypothetical protein
MPLGGNQVSTPAGYTHGEGPRELAGRRDCTLSPLTELAV